MVFVTGGGSGIGRATALKFAANGWRVVILGRRLSALEETARHAAGASQEVIVHACDLRDPAAIDATVSSVLKQFGRVDALVNAAGTNVTRRSLAEFSLSAYDDVVATNLHGAVRCTLALLPTMRRQRRGTIININSEAGRAASARAGAAYTISKFGLNGFTQVLNVEERDNGIRACSIFPGDVDTPLVDRRPSVPASDTRAKFLRPGDVAEAVWFVASLPAHVVVEELLMRQA